MSMSLKAELDTWAAALKAYDEQDFQQALDLFSRIADSAKILTNMGLIYATIGYHEIAVEHFIAAVNLDNYLAIAYFQCGVSNFLLERYDQALTNFENAYLYLRGNEAINYEQIGLKFLLFSAEIMFNKGLSQIYLGNTQEGMLDMQEASRQKVTEEHDVIDDAIQECGEGYTVFSIPVGVLYRPSENKLKNSKSKDYLGKAKLVAASNSNDAFTEFTGVMRLQQASEENGGDRDLEGKPQSEPVSNLNRSATVPVLPTDRVAPRPIILERSKTTVQLGANAVRGPPSVAALASRRSQSVSNPNLARSDSALGRNNTLGRSNSAVGRPGLARNESARAGTIGLRPITPQSSGAGAVAGAGAGGSRQNAVTGGGGAGGSAGAASVLKARPSLRGLQTPAKFQEPIPVPSLPPTQGLPASRQVINPGQGAAPFVLPAVLSSRSPDGSNDSQFYDTYIDAYTDDASRPNAVAAPPSQIQQQQVRGQSPGLAYQQPQPQLFETSQPAWIQTAPSPSLSGTSSSGHSRTPSRAAMMNNLNMNAGQYTGMGITNASGGRFRRKMIRRPTAHRVTAYDDEEGDDGFVTGEYEELEMANIRVKLHYQGDVRGMAIPPTTTFEEFVERVTTKFGSSLTGLALKFKDEEGTMITLRDESDFELAIETARENAKGRSEGKIEVWCTNI